MDCCQCEGIEEQFSDEHGQDKLKEYRKKGAEKTTHILVNTLIAQGIEGASLLDIGGGVGAIQHALLKAGISHSTNLDASAGYIEACRDEAERQGHAEKITHIHGDFANLDTAPEADIVTLERVICCYHDMPGLMNQACIKAKNWLGIIYPRDTWWVKLAVRFGLNSVLKLQRTSFRVFVHPTEGVNTLIQSHGFQQKFHKNVGFWQVVIFQKAN